MAGLLGLGACSDELNTEPTQSVSGSTIFANVESAKSSIDGVYRMMYTAGWSSNWSHENCGQMAIHLLADLMAEDHLMYAQGQGWFYEDYRLNVHGDYDGKSGRSYAIWNFYYTIISNVNYIIANDDPEGGTNFSISGDAGEAASLIGQAYAMRAYAYFYLIQLYQQTYDGNQNKPGVPLYDKPTFAGSTGAPRGTVEGVYTQINSDITRAETLLKGKEQSHISHVDYYVAKGIEARVALVQHKYPEAAAAAAEALKKPGLDLATVAELGGNNDSSVKDVMWGVVIQADQSSNFASFFSHMDADAAGMYGGKGQQCISSGLYKLIPSTDDRRSKWFRGDVGGDNGGSHVDYCQLKFRMKDVTTRTGDYLFMRAEEMVIIKAEAECHQNLYSEARTTIAQLGAKRDSDYAARLAGRSDSDDLSEDVNAQPVTLMEEILFQRRVELWGESGRIFDLQRLHLGYDRTYSGSNHTEKVANKDTSAGSDYFVLPLPQSEIDGNENISASDNNPIMQ